MVFLDDVTGVFISGATLSTMEGQENLPRPEEERLTEAEKNKKMQDQLKVSKSLHARPIGNGNC